MAGAPQDTPLMLRADAGAVEAIVTEVEGGAPAGIAVVCHPNPLQDGTMHNKVVTMVARAFARRDIPALRFNYRGVGKSEGVHDDGIGETDDCVAMVQAMRERHGELPVWLAGFSFGAFVALRASRRVDCAGLVLIAPAVNLRFDFDAPMPDCPVLVIQGDADRVVDPDAVKGWVASREPQPRLEVMPGVGHFFHGKLTKLSALVDGFVADA